MGDKRNKSESFSARKMGLKTDEITIEKAHRIRKKKQGKRRTIISKYLNYNQREKVTQIQRAETIGESNT